MLDAARCKSFKEVVDGIMVPVMEGAGQNVECYFTEKDIQYTFQQELPFLLAKSLQDELEGVDQDNALHSCAFLAEVFLSDRS